MEGRLFNVTWNNENALVLMINTQARPPPSEQHDGGAMPRCGGCEAENQELKAILDTATDGVLVLDRAGRVLSANRSAQALFGYDAARHRANSRSATCWRRKAGARCSTISTGWRATAGRKASTPGARPSAW